MKISSLGSKVPHDWFVSSLGFDKRSELDLGFTKHSAVCLSFTQTFI